MLGPDFMTDIIKVETSDHAVLNVRISFNNQFIFDEKDKESVERIFSVPDFIGYACSLIGLFFILFFFILFFLNFLFFF